MSIFSTKKLNTLDELLTNQLQDLYDAEHRIVDALPKMADKAKTPKLASAFREHLKETEGQISRLEQVFKSLEQKPKREACEATKGLIAEGEEILKAEGDDAVIDAGLIAAAQRVEHYEMAGYGTARTLAQQLGHTQAADLLQQTLDEEVGADKTLTTIAESTVNVKAG